MSAASSHLANLAELVATRCRALERSTLATAGQSLTPQLSLMLADDVRELLSDLRAFARALPTGPALMRVTREMWAIEGGARVGLGDCAAWWDAWALAIDPRSTSITLAYRLGMPSQEVKLPARLDGDGGAP